MPRSATTMLDLSELPSSQRREVRDFVEFLLARRTAPRKPAPGRFTKLINEPLTVDSLDIPGRESLHER